MWRNGRISGSSYLDVETSKYQYPIINPNPLELITGYIMDNSVCGSSSKRLPRISMNLIYGSISSYFSILNSPEGLDMINKANRLESVLGDIYYERLGSKEDSKKISIGA